MVVAIMALQVHAHGIAQSPLMPELPLPISVVPSKTAAIAAASSASSSSDDRRIIIEIPSVPSLQVVGESDHPSIPRGDHGTLHRHKCPEQDVIRPSDTLPSTTSILSRLVSSIKQNLREVMSVLRHYPAPVIPSRGKGPTGNVIGNGQAVGYLGNGNQWGCRWYGACRTVNWLTSIQPSSDSGPEDETYLSDTGEYHKNNPKDWSNDSRVFSEIPQYVLDYAPLVYLFSGEQFWPGNIAEHLEHVTPNLNYTPIFSRTQNLNLTNLDDMNEYDRGRFIYLKSDDNVEERPDWLGGQKNVPNATENLHYTPPKHPRLDPRASQEKPSRGGRSDAPAILIVIDKGHGIVDAFWFFFYSYNLGNIVLNVRFGNHVGDWEHTLVRFQHGKPKLMFLSEHFFGEAYTYDAVEKIGKRVSHHFPVSLPHL